MTDQQEVVEARERLKMILAEGERCLCTSPGGTAFTDLGVVLDAVEGAEAVEDQASEPNGERELTPCGNLVCTGCRVCGCPALGIAPERQGEPSDDEREVMRRIIAEGSYSRSRDDLPYQDVADRLVAAGFGTRRTEVPETSAAMEAAVQSRDWDTVRRLQDEPEPQRAIYLHDSRDSLKMVRETLCAVQNGAAGVDRMTHSDRVGRIIADIDRQRPLGSNGKHGDRHTPTCGCDRPEPQGEASNAREIDLGAVRRVLDEWRDAEDQRRFATVNWQLIRANYSALLGVAGGVR